MANSSDWIREGADVGLFWELKLVGKGTIISANPNSICHLVPLGDHRVHLKISEVYDNNMKLDGGDLLKDMAGSFLTWEKCNIRPFMEVDSVSREAETPGPFFSRDTSRSIDTGEPESLIRPRSSWMGMIVKVVDIYGVTFAVASVHITNCDVKVVDTPLGQTHVGISVDEFMDNASREHRLLKDRLLAWPIERLIASDGNSLEFHSKSQDGCAPDVSSQKRPYLHLSRRKKQAPLSLTRKQISLSQEDVANLSTQDCCYRRCCQLFRREIALKIREQYWAKTFQMRKEYEINAIRNTLELQSGHNIIVVEGVVVCLEAWRIIHSRGRSQFSELKKMVKGGMTESSHGNKGKKRMSERVSQAYSSMTEIIDQSSDHHPTKNRTAADKSRRVMRELPTSMTWESIRNHVNGINANVGCGNVSQSTISLLRKSKFQEVVIHKKGNNFSKCTTCSELQERKAHLLGNKEESVALKRDEIAHHDEHSQGRLLYHTWRHQSICRPKEYLCIIHDKMDHCKTAIPWLPHCPKTLDGAFKFPITLTGILTHGHGPKAIAQYNVPLWPSDANTMIGSLDSILRMLENPEPMIKTFFKGPDSTNLFHKLLNGVGDVLECQLRKAFKDDTDFISNLAAEASSTSTPFHKPLPRILKLQLDNCAGDNKNRYVIAYLSLLNYREVFEEIHIGFLMPGHTHEDVDAMFGNFSEILLHHHASCLPDLMGLLMRARKPNPVPHFIQEVPDFKKYLQPYMLTGTDALVGHLKPRLFRLYVKDDSMPCLQYKLKATDEEWLPHEGIEMWKWTTEKLLNLPTGLPKRLPMTEIKMLDEVQDGIQKYIGFYELVLRGMAEAGKPAYERLIQYWKDVLHVLKSEVIQYREEDGEELVQGFWPISTWRDHVPAQYQAMACELDTPIDYVGPQRNRPRQAFNPRADIEKGHIILQRPDTEDLKAYPIFLGCVVSDGVEEGELNVDNRREHVCKVKWYRPFMEKGRGQRSPLSESKRWENCWTKKWERDPGYPDIETISVNSVLWSYKPRRTAKTSGKTGFVTIPKGHAIKAKDNLERCLEAEAIE